MKFRLLQLATPPVPEVPSRLFLSDNSKTGLSINVSIAKTCRPTSACMEYCYGLESRIRMPAALQRQIDNYARFEHLGKVDEKNLLKEVYGIAYEVQARQDFIRFFGVGDLQLGSVRFINALAREVPDLKIWVATRKFGLAARLVHLPNLHVMLSLDSTTKNTFKTEAFNLAGSRYPEYYVAWVRQANEQDLPPPFATVIFDEHHQGKRSKFKEPDPRTCPATAANGISHDNACMKCRFCFDAGKRQKDAHQLKPPMDDKGRKETVHLPIYE